MNRITFRNIIIFTVLISVSSLFGQNNNSADQEAQKKARENHQFRVAQRYQRSNQHENALRILKALYNDNVGSVKYYRALLETYLKMNMMEEAKQLIEQQKAKDTKNPRYEIDYGDVLYKSGEKERAKQTWDLAIQKYSANVGVYSILANVLASNRLYDDAIEVYAAAYEKHPDKHYLLKNIADFQARRLQYYDALTNYIEYIRNDSRNYQTVIRQVLSFKVEGLQIDSLIYVLNFESQRQPVMAEINILAAKFYQKYQRYADALRIYQQLENHKSQGRYLIEFGQSVQSDSLYDLALEAYNIVIDRFPGSNQVLPAYLGAARCNLEIARRENEQTYAREAVDMINQVRQKYPTHSQVAELSLLEGDIYRQFFFDIDRAIRIYLSVAQRYQKNDNLRDKANLSAGESYIIHGDLANAEATLKRISSPNFKARALFYLAKIKFYQADYEGTKSYLDQIIQSQGLSGRIANDALDMQTILTNEGEAPEALKYYAEADWLLMQQKKSEAVGRMQSAIDKVPPPHFRMRIIFEAARLSSDLGKYPEALEYCNQVIQDKELQLYADEALYIMANIVEYRLNDLPQAYKLYDQLLAEFPESQFGVSARERLKEIRRQSPELTPLN